MAEVVVVVSLAASGGGVTLGGVSASGEMGEGGLGDRGELGDGLWEYSSSLDKRFCTSMFFDSTTSSASTSLFLVFSNS